MLSGSGSARTSSVSDLRYFLVVYDPRGEDLVDLKEFRDQEEAGAAYFAAEKAHDGDGIQVLLFDADSIESIKRTHPHYFSDSNGDTLEFAASTPA